MPNNLGKADTPEVAILAGQEYPLLVFTLLAVPASHNFVFYHVL
jgi:hypothetical protein